jgi:hypothetical protein
VAAQLVASRVVLSSTELDSGGCSVGIVRLQTKGHGVCLRDEVTEVWRKLHNEELGDLYFSLKLELSSYRG